MGTRRSGCGSSTFCPRARRGKFVQRSEFGLFLRRGNWWDEEHVLGSEMVRIRYRHGDSSGAINIAIVHRERGNWKAMLAWSRKASALGDGDAELDMAKCYLQGRGTLRSRAKVLKHLRRAIRSSHISPAGREEAVALRKCIVPVFQLESKK